MRVVLVPVHSGVVLPADVAGVIAGRDVRGAEVGVWESGDHMSGWRLVLCI